MNRCVVCDRAVPLSVRAFTRCLHCSCGALCMMHRLPEQHGCQLDQSDRQKTAMASLETKLMTEACMQKKI